MRMKKRIKTVIVIAVILLTIIVIDMICSQKMLSVTKYEYRTEKVSKEIRVVHLTDMHNYQFGKENRRLVKRVGEQSPDLIFVTGDMLNEYEERTDIVENLIRDLRGIAPVYFSMGNHEVNYGKNESYPKDLREKLERAGAVVLEKEYADIEVNGQELRIGGAYGYLLRKKWHDGSEQRFMKAFQDTDRFKILLSHKSEGLLLWKGLERWKVELVFSGHAHGGQMRLPIIGGLYSPEEKYFPTYTKGMYECGNGTVILSAGLGSSHGIPRVNNLPEIVVCDIVPK